MTEITTKTSTKVMQVFKVDTMKLTKKNLVEEDKLKKEIHKLTLVEKIRQIAQLKKKTTDIQHSHM